MALLEKHLVIEFDKDIEDYRRLVDPLGIKVLLEGDYYHDKIGAQIEGYLLALEDLGYKVILTEIY